MTHIPHEKLTSLDSLLAIAQQQGTNTRNLISLGNSLNEAKLHRDSIESKVEVNIKKLLGVGNISGLQTQINDAKLHRDSNSGKIEDIFTRLTKKSDISHGHGTQNIIDQIKAGLLGGGIGAIAVAGVIGFILLRGKI